MTLPLSRRGWLAASAGVATTTLLSAAPAAAARSPWRFCLNTSTIRGQRLSLTDEIDLAARVGYHAIEPWIGELEQYQKEGGKLRDLAKRLQDRGLVVPSAIGFAEWIVDDETRRKRGLEQARRDMGWVAELGGTRIAAPPAGATDRADLSLLAAAERYRALCELGERQGVIPQVEVWGFSQSLSRLGETALVAIESGHPRACILPDVYHLHKGGSAFGGLHVLGSAGFHMFHVNDYPADPPRQQIKDADRVYPGDGVAPWKDIVATLRTVGFAGHLSLELFNPTYWKQDAERVARTGLEKMKALFSDA